jgi:hypothetical protein
MSLSIALSLMIALCYTVHFMGILIHCSALTVSQGGPWRCITSHTKTNQLCDQPNIVLDQLTVLKES